MNNPLERHPFEPVPGVVYRNANGREYRCLAVEHDMAWMVNILSGWTFRAHHLMEYPDGSIEWGFSTDGGFGDKDVLEPPVPVRICPICGCGYTEPPALSRRDNQTLICPACGLEEALDAWRIHQQSEAGLDG